MAPIQNIDNPQNKFIYEIQVGGISCTNCAKKITTGLAELKEVNKSSVNVLSEKVMVDLNEDNLENLKAKLTDLKFHLVSIPIQIKNNEDKNTRIAYFQSKINRKNTSNKIELTLETLQKDITQITGVQSCKTHLEQDEVIVEVNYNPSIVKSQELLQEISNYDSEQLKFSAKNVHLEKFSKKGSHKLSTTFSDLVLALSITVFIVIYALIIPLVDSIYEKVHDYPFEWNVFSIYILILFLVTTFVILKYGISSLKTAVNGYRKYKVLSMETLIALGSFSAYFMGIFLLILYTIQNEQEKDEISDKKLKENRHEQIKMIVHMFESTSLILTIVVLGKYLEGKAKATILQMTEKMFPENEMIKNKNATYLEPKNRKLDIKEQKSLDVCLLEKGDLIKLEAGQKLLVDGIVLKIEDTLQAIDSVCFGWDEPFTVNKGDRLKSGATIAQGGGILQVENTIEDSMLLKISNQLNVAQHDQESSEDGIQGLFKFLSDYFIKAVICISIIVLIVWFILIGTDSVNVEDEFCTYCVPIQRAISVLVASCPCALGLAIPCVITITLNLAMENSILIKKNSIFDKILKVKSVIFDKTGTLFTKVDKITEFRQIGNDFTLTDIWQTIAVVEKESRHPIAELLYKEALKNLGDNCLNIPYKVIGKVKTHKTGLQAELNSNGSNTPIPFLIGNKTLMADNNVVLDQESQLYLNDQSNKGFTCLMVALNGKIAFQISLDNTANLREEACDVVNYLQKTLKKDVYILSGDAKETVRKVGQHLNIPDENLIGETDAESKKKLISTLKEKTGKEVMMIGDGLNDILSIQEAGIGVTINAKSEMNLLASDVVALNENLWHIVSLFKLIQYSRYFIYINLLWAFAYNIFILPVAAGVFYSLSFTVSPTVASIFMSGSSVVVVIFSNFMRLIQFDQSKKYMASKKKTDRSGVYKETQQTRKQELVNNLNIAGENKV